MQNITITQAKASSLIQAKVDEASESLSKKVNEILIEALAVNLGIESPNPFDYINRLTKREHGDGGNTVFLDGVEILWVGPFKYEWDPYVPRNNQSAAMMFKYRIIHNINQVLEKGAST